MNQTKKDVNFFLHNLEHFSKATFSNITSIVNLIIVSDDSSLKALIRKISEFQIGLFFEKLHNTFLEFDRPTKLID